MKLLIILSSLLIISISSFAQTVISGNIKDQAEDPVPFAFVTIITSDSAHKNMAAKIADTSGKFELTLKDKGQYIIRVTAVGFEEIKKNISVDKNNPVRLDFVMKKLVNNLNDVTVNAKLPMVEKKIDRIVMNVDNNPLATGKSSMETIGLAPGILVYNNQILLNGIPVSRIMVNGKMLQLTGESLNNYLNSLRSDDIKSIEIMAHPPAEYDAEGAGGIINIILKKGRETGLNGSVYGNFSEMKKYFNFPGTSDGLQLNFKKGKVGLFANYDYNYNKHFQFLKQNRSFSNNGIYTATDSANKHSLSNDIHAGMTYDITDKQYLAIDYTGSFSNDVENWVAKSIVSYPSNPANNIRSKGTFPNVWNGKYNDIGINYHIQTDTLGSSFTLLSDYTHNSNQVNNSVTSTTIENNIATDTAYKNFTPSIAKIFTADAKYLKVFNAESNLSFGAKLSSTNINNMANFQYQSPYGSEWIDSKDQNFIYNYKENIIAGYLNYKGNILKTDVQIGLRGENTHYTGILYDTSYVKTGKNYFGLFPSLFLKRNLNKAADESLTFIYTRRLSRPSFDNLNPHVVYVDNYTTGRGNPYLQPEYDNSYGLDYTLKNKYTFTANYFYANDVIINGIHPVSGSPDQMTQQPVNSGTSSKWMLSAYIPINLTKWWTTQEYVEYDYRHMNAPGAFNFSKNLVTLSTNMQFNLGKDFTASLHAFYLNSIISNNAILDHIGGMDIAMQKKFLNKHLTLKAALDDVFSSENNVKGTFYYTNFNLNFSDIERRQKFTLGIAYNFDLGKSFKSHKIESSNEEEQSRLK